jgi:hexosaminidase
MSWVKINHFHWHVVDSQSFPIIIPGFEELSQKGAYTSSKVYTTNDVKDIVQYAAAVCPHISTRKSNFQC